MERQSETISQPFKYVGQYGVMAGVMAESNGLYYMRARYYNPEIGRFISEDPLGFGGGDVNLFTYVMGNPVNFIDPLGLRWVGDGDDPNGWTVGRDTKGSPIKTGEGNAGGWLEENVPAMETMSEIHDVLVGALVPNDIPIVTPIVDTVVNIPTMPVCYVIAVVYETGSSIVDLFSGINNFIFGDEEDNATWK